MIAEGFWAGAMSGTSLDGVDCVLARRTKNAFSTVAMSHRDFPEGLHEELASLLSPSDNEIERAALAANRLADVYAETFLDACASAGVLPKDVRALGAHGQTVRHAPEKSYTVQIVNGARLAVLAGVPVVTDFRSSDMALGGEGAPLVPAFHAQVFSAKAPCAVLNVGGIANVTLLGEDRVYGFDCGPGNTLMDAVARRHFQKPCDVDGALAFQGKVREDVLASLLADSYFARKPPKSTGREYFNEAWLDGKLAYLEPVDPRDLLATLALLTAKTAAEAVTRSGIEVRKLFVCGGGAKNPFLMGCLRKELPVSVSSTASIGLDPMAVEGAAFAWLAAMRLAGLAAGMPEVTGASRPAVLGAVHLP